MSSNTVSQLEAKLRLSLQDDASAQAGNVARKFQSLMQTINQNLAKPPSAFSRQIEDLAKRQTRAIDDQMRALQRGLQPVLRDLRAVDALRSKGSPVGRFDDLRKAAEDARWLRHNLFMLDADQRRKLSGYNLWNQKSREWVGGLRKDVEAEIAGTFGASLYGRMKLHGHRMREQLGLGWREAAAKQPLDPAREIGRGMVAGGVVREVGGAAARGGRTLIEDANEFERIRQNMRFAGVNRRTATFARVGRNYEVRNGIQRRTIDEVEEASREARHLSSRYRNMSATEVLELINESRMVYGSQRSATHHADPMIRFASFLKSYESGKHAGVVHDAQQEMIAAVKSGEIAGNVTPQEMEHHLGRLVAMKVAFGKQVSVRQYLQAQRAAGVSYLASNDEYRYSFFPAMVQEFSSGAGVMQMTAANKILADAGNKKAAIANQQALGLRDENGEWKNREMFGRNQLEWIATTMIPALEAKGLKFGTTIKDTDVVGIVQAISGAFPDRNAAKQLVEIAVQMNKLRKDAALMEKIATGKDETDAYNKGSLGYQMGAVTAQFNNLITVLGGPLVPAAVQALERLAGVLEKLGHAAEANPGLSLLGGAAGVGGVGYLAYRLAKANPRAAAALGFGSGMMSGGWLPALLGGAGVHMLFGGGDKAKAVAGSLAPGAAAAGSISKRQGLLRRAYNAGAIGKGLTAWSLYELYADLAKFEKEQMGGDGTGAILATGAGAYGAHKLQQAMQAKGANTPGIKGAVMRRFPGLQALLLAYAGYQMLSGGSAKADTLPGTGAPGAGGVSDLGNLSDADLEKLAFGGGMGLDGLDAMAELQDRRRRRRASPAADMGVLGQRLASGQTGMPRDDRAPSHKGAQAGAEVEGAVSSALNQARGRVQAEDWTSEGQRLADSIAAGIRAGAAGIVAAIQETIGEQARRAVREAYSDGGLR